MNVLPKEMQVVPDGHNRITVLVSQPDHTRKWYQGHFKSTRGWVSEFGPVNLASSYWYQGFESQDVVDFLCRFHYTDEDELIIGESDFGLVESSITGPIVDLGEYDVRIVSDVNKVRSKRAFIIYEPSDERKAWGACHREGNGIFSAPVEKTLEGVLRSMRRSVPKDCPVFVNKTALVPVSIAAARQALPIRIVYRPELPLKVYPKVKKPTFGQVLVWFLAWKATA